ncbi:uncharacterized protein LOC133338017 [Musca vetustissima]|uniref:uncharacterized protein LOC133338017 n=1 Tax=Musca vetustissima TaxID=27455 RepID=UPI002AB77851|nr:uncharacterized protein LOC133338017 [Musca vetustissima]
MKQVEKEEIMESEIKLLAMVDHLNAEYNVELNLIINIGENEGVELEAILQNVQLPKIITTASDVKLSNLYRNFNMNILSLVLLKQQNMNESFMALDQLLWRRHYTPIIFIYKTMESNTILDIFQKAWQQGHTSVVVWWQNKVFSYNPYPSIKIKQLETPQDFMKHLLQQQNFNKFEIKVPLFHNPPRSFSYVNREGVEIRTGFFWKTIETFVTSRNGTLQYEFFDIWSTDLNRETVTDFIMNAGYSFIPTMVVPKGDFEKSNAIHFAHDYLLTAVGKEIPENQYLLITFDTELWLMADVIFIIIFLILLTVKRLYFNIVDISGCLLCSFKVLIFTYDVIYGCNLSSIYVSRIYEPDLNTLQDIARTNLRVQVYGLEYDHLMSLENLPKFLYSRMFVGNNTEFQENRHNLHLPNIITGMEDIVEFMLFQQLYMTRPIARYIPESFYSIPLCIPIPHRSPFLNDFNRKIPFYRAVPKHRLILKIT